MPVTVPSSRETKSDKPRNQNEFLGQEEIDMLTECFGILQYGQICVKQSS